MITSARHELPPSILINDNSRTISKLHSSPTIKYQSTVNKVREYKYNLKKILT